MSPSLTAVRSLVKGFLKELRSPSISATSGAVELRSDPSSTTGMYVWSGNRSALARPEYLWCTLQAARLAKALGCPDVWVIEFGVAGGNGLVALERAAEVAEELLDVQVRVAGFDSGTGMPAPKDERDIPWAIQPGILPMDEVALRTRLTRAELVLGPVESTVVDWVAALQGTIGFAAFDLDMYSSTMAALRVLDAHPDRLLPRVACYFDDIFGYGWNDFTGARAAIHDFNGSHERRKISPIYGLKYELEGDDRLAPWPEKIYLAHIFESPRYNTTEWVIPQAWSAAHRLQG
jgi:hypothetical protein